MKLYRAESPDGSAQYFSTKRECDMWCVGQAIKILPTLISGATAVFDIYKRDVDVSAENIILLLNKQQPVPAAEPLEEISFVLDDNGNVRKVAAK